MTILDDAILGPEPTDIEVVRPAGRRAITHAFHDVDGTHSFIRDWPPVMSLVLHHAMTCGLGEDFDSEPNIQALTERVGRVKLPETDRFCVESAGLLAITQMEFAIRRAVQMGNVPPSVGLDLTEEERRRNAEIIRRIWRGEERFDDAPDPPELAAFIADRAPRLFQLYEKVLCRASRDRNLAEARKHPERWRVPGSLEFLAHLRRTGCRNYFITGAVIQPGGGMREEVQTLGFEVGPGLLVEDILGSAWDRKRPKDEVMRDLVTSLNIDPREVLVVGDGRTEIRAGVEMGAVTISRLPHDAHRQRQLHRQLRTNYIVPDFTSPLLFKMFQPG